jgi:hypothetical protein
VEPFELEALDERDADRVVVFHDARERESSAGRFNRRLSGRVLPVFST